MNDYIHVNCEYTLSRFYVLLLNSLICYCRVLTIDNMYARLARPVIRVGSTTCKMSSLSQGCLVFVDSYRTSWAPMGVGT